GYAPPRPVRYECVGGVIDEPPGVRVRPGGEHLSLPGVVGQSHRMGTEHDRRHDRVGRIGNHVQAAAPDPACDEHFSLPAVVGYTGGRGPYGDGCDDSVRRIGDNAQAAETCVEDEEFSLPDDVGYD